MESVENPGLVAEVLPGASKEILGGVIGMTSLLPSGFLCQDTFFDGDDAHVIEKGEVEVRFRRSERLLGRRELGHVANGVIQNAG